MMERAIGGVEDFLASCSNSCETQNAAIQDIMTSTSLSLSGYTQCDAISSSAENSYKYSSSSAVDCHSLPHYSSPSPTTGLHQDTFFRQSSQPVLPPQPATTPMNYNNYNRSLSCQTNTSYQMDGYQSAYLQSTHSAPVQEQYPSPAYNPYIKSEPVDFYQSENNQSSAPSSPESVFDEYQHLSLIHI